MNSLKTPTSFWNENKVILPFWKRLFFRNTKSQIRLRTPDCIHQNCSGISLGNQSIRSILFSTDIALIEHSDCDAVLAVYPFAPSAKIMKTLIDFSEKPVICGIGGGLTQGPIALAMAQQAEQLGAAAVIVNQPFRNRDIEKIKSKIGIPIISSISMLDFDFKKRIESGVDLFHITGGNETCRIIEYLQQNYPNYPVMATGGKTLTNISAAIDIGAQAIVLTPPSNGELFKSIMQNYRNGLSILK
ncbi:hypothetical protein [Flavobacterium sp. NKUCC04_CG]|uniref:hypothetical protein n=1 Tax=Flavobacterium sp. NKUCC04_CG TaxID=2842121 RepID=UPI001C5B3B30|nr:hypothetical protein [Flavobacterium sp. NKUCC04_CG]MBW3519203.1 hypothetical protein [Flavobacterium sp. NKUCC04_CG]